MFVLTKWKTFIETAAKKTLGRILQSIVKSKLRQYNLSLLVDASDFSTVDFYNISGDMSVVSNLPFSIGAFSIENIRVSLTTFNVQVSGVVIHLDVRKTSRKDNDENSDMDFGDDYGEKDNEIKEVQNEAMTILTNWLSSLFFSISVCIQDVTLRIKTDMGVSHNSQNHEMVASIDQTSIIDWNSVVVKNVKLDVCPMTSSMLFETIHIDKTENDVLLLDFTNETGKIDFCGDSFFIISCFCQSVAENQRVLAKVKEKEKFSIKKINLVKEVQVKNVNIIVDFYNGSDLDNKRMLHDRISMKIFEVVICCNFVKDTFLARFTKLQTTIGYVNKPAQLQMAYSTVENNWDLKVDIETLHIETSQNIVKHISVILNFQTLWNEYYLIFNNDDTIKFNRVIVNNIFFSTRYYNLPFSLKKVLKGNFAQLIPLCDLKIKIPIVLLNDKTGWNEVVNSYFDSIIASQKMKCFRKVILGFAKKKVKNVMQSKSKKTTV
jgi:hypothetical protein